jgi:hypothetical protein
LKSTERVRRVVALVTAGFQLHAEAHAVFFECVVDVVGELEVELMAAAAFLRAAVVKSARDENRLAHADGAAFGVEPTRLETYFVEKLLAKHTRIGKARDVFGLVLRVAARW